ncbi:FMN-binding protein [Ktedonobacter racemifer]|uniref:FMN-binding domain protein n=1 Tax=Ktedonobacter racemifer DSM 44963 TaxID=485913 RepID=D6U1G6_KTERA|nr:FMN-binding protein [Ktedonobacter racemifer]EFH82610.1 FMN-binding domain protein [Ktedonobacter racemifer DSM 44963]
MKKLTIAVFIIGIFILYSFTYNQAIALLPNRTRYSIGVAGNDSLPSTSTTPASTTTSTNGTQYKDGSFTGDVEDAHWGNIQVKAIIQNGKITDVQFLQFPNERNRSVVINNYADPILTNEAIQAQNANVDIVSGATDSSEAFMQSLTTALSQAKA